MKKIFKYSMFKWILLFTSILIIVLVTDSEKLAVIVTFPELDIWVAPKVEVEVRVIFLSKVGK